jgi:hypothetical protein
MKLTKLLSVLLTVLIIMSFTTVFVYATEPDPAFSDFPYYIKVGQVEWDGSITYYYIASQNYIEINASSNHYYSGGSSSSMTLFDADENLVSTGQTYYLNTYKLHSSNHNIYDNKSHYNVYPIALPNIINVSRSGSDYNNANIFTNAEKAFISQTGTTNYISLWLSGNFARYVYLRSDGLIEIGAGSIPFDSINTSSYDVYVSQNSTDVFFSKTQPTISQVTIQSLSSLVPQTVQTTMMILPGLILAFCLMVLLIFLVRFFRQYLMV